MPCYHLQTDDLARPLRTIAGDRREALAHFGEKFGKTLTLEETDAGTAYLLDEWQKNSGPHWVNPTIAVYVAR